MQKNIVTIAHFVREYNKYSGAQATISGFEYKGVIYMVEFHHIPASLQKASRESSKNGGYFKTQIDWSVANKKKYISNGKAIAIMTLDDLMAIPTKKSANMGHKFEKFFATQYASENPNWKEGGNDRFDKCGDVVINGLETQIKFGNASLTNINTIHKIQNEHRKMRKSA